MTDHLAIWVILPAAGSSSRFSTDPLAPRSKLDEDLGGRPVLQRSIELFHTRPEVAGVIVAGPHDDEPFAAFQLRHADKIALLGGTLCRGGKSHRSESVAAALALVPESATHIAVHDAARPAAPPDLIDRVFEAARRHPAVIPAIPVPDTIKRATEPETIDAPHDPLAAVLGMAPADATARFVSETLDRARLVAAQTPQVFAADLLRRAYAQPDPIATDDAHLVERLGERVALIEGDARNLKITTPTDLAIVRAVLGLSGSAARAAHKKF